MAQTLRAGEARRAPRPSNPGLAGLGNMALAVATARRGGATPGEVLNTGPLEAILNFTRHTRSAPGM